MSNENAQRDENRVVTMLGVTNDEAQEIRNVLIDPDTGAMLVKAIDGSGTNIYNSDGALTGNRTVDIDEKKLSFNGALETSGKLSERTMGDFDITPYSGLAATLNGITDAMKMEIDGSDFLFARGVGDMESLMGDEWAQNTIYDIVMDDTGNNVLYNIKTYFNSTKGPSNILSTSNGVTSNMRFHSAESIFESHDNPSDFINVMTELGGNSYIIEGNFDDGSDSRRLRIQMSVPDRFIETGVFDDINSLSTKHKISLGEENLSDEYGEMYRVATKHGFQVFRTFQENIDSVSSASATPLTKYANTFMVTGTGNIDFVDSRDAMEGTRISLFFSAGNKIINLSSATPVSGFLPLKLIDGNDIVCSEDTLINFTRIGEHWVQTSPETTYHPKVIENTSVSGTLNIDWNEADTYKLELAGSTTFTESNLPVNNSKQLTLYITGDYPITYPSSWVPVAGSYDGTMNNQYVVEGLLSEAFFSINNF